MNAHVDLSHVDASKQAGNDFVLPATYAIRAALNDLNATHNLRGTDKHWLWKFGNAVAAGRLDLSALVQDIQYGPTSSAVLTRRYRETRKGGKPGLDFTMTRLVPDRFREHRNDTGWGGLLDVAVIRKDEIHARKDCLEERSCVSGLAVCRHAFERLYVREKLTHPDVRRRILTDMAHLDRMLAFAVAANLFCYGDAYSRNAVTMLPMGQGLLVVRNAVILTEDGWRPSVRNLRKKKRLFRTPTAHDPYRSLEGIMVEGKPTEGFLIAMGVTYLSKDLLRFEQQAYASLFRSEANRFNLEELGANMGRTWLAHEPQPPRISIEVRDELHYLLSLISRPKNFWPYWYCVGWDGSSDPASA